MISVFLLLTSLNMIISWSIQVAANGIISFLWLSSIPLCVCVCAHAHTRACMCTPYIFIHSSVDGCLGCFHFLAVRNSSAMSIQDACVFFKESFVQLYAQEQDNWIK